MSKRKILLNERLNKKAKLKIGNATKLSKTGVNESGVVELKSVRQSDDQAIEKPKWINKQRVLIFSSRGVSYRDRHLMKDLRTLLPHSKADTKMDRKDKLAIVNEICEMRNCNKCIFFEAKKKKDLYVWMSNSPRGPSAKFLVENVHTMAELKLTGNCLKGSRPLLSFSEVFTKAPQFILLKELFTQIFSTPRNHPKSQPFTDHVFTFSVLDNRIWFRNYQILAEDGSLAEIGPRFVLNPIRIFEGSFGGATLYVNPHYVSPNQYRRELKLATANKYTNRIQAKRYLEHRQTDETYPNDKLDDIFQTVPPEEAKGVEKQLYIRKR